jgi:hypothetical protein
MDTMFTNGHSIVMPENNNMNFDMLNNSESLSAEALKSMMNKRKLVSTDFINGEQIYQENGNDSAKRLCSMNGQQNEQKI